MNSDGKTFDVATPPVENKRGGSLRRVAECLAQATPLTAGLAHLYAFTHPGDFERQLQTWREEISSETNDLSERLRMIEDILAPRMIISELALDIALLLSETSAKGLDWDAVEFDTILKQFPDAEPRKLQRSCAELEHHNLTQNSAAMGHPVLNLAPRYQLFWMLDPVTQNTAPSDDAKSIVELLLENSRFGSIPTLEEHLGWTKRRLNPALALALQFVDPRRISKSMQPDYVTRSVSLLPEDEMRLERFLAGID